jgi:hypothetical protein
MEVCTERCDCFSLMWFGVFGHYFIRGDIGFSRIYIIRSIDFPRQKSHHTKSPKIESPYCFLPQKILPQADDVFVTCGAEGKFRDRPKMERLNSFFLPCSFFARTAPHDSPSCTIKIAPPKVGWWREGRTNMLY